METWIAENVNQVIHFFSKTMQAKRRVIQEGIMERVLMNTKILVVLWFLSLICRFYVWSVTHNITCIGAVFSEATYHLIFGDRFLKISISVCLFVFFSNKFCCPWSMSLLHTIFINKRINKTLVVFCIIFIFLLFHYFL